MSIPTRKLRPIATALGAALLAALLASPVQAGPRGWHGPGIVPRPVHPLRVRPRVRHFVVTHPYPGRVLRAHDQRTCYERCEARNQYCWSHGGCTPTACDWECGG